MQSNMLEVLPIVLTIVISVFAGLWALLTFLKAELKSLADKIDELTKSMNRLEKEYVSKSDCRDIRAECPAKSTATRLEKLCESRI